MHIKYPGADSSSYKGPHTIRMTLPFLHVLLFFQKGPKKNVKLEILGFKLAWHESNTTIYQIRN